MSTVEELRTQGSEHEGRQDSSGEWPQTSQKVRDEEETHLKKGKRGRRALDETEQDHRRAAGKEGNPGRRSLEGVRGIHEVMGSDKKKGGQLRRKDMAAESRQQLKKQ